MREHIDELIADKISGQISAEDDALLTKYIGTDESVRLQWEQSLAAVALYKATQQGSNINEKAAWNKLVEKLGAEPPTVKLKTQKFRWLVAASILVPLLLVSLLWFSLSNSDMQFAQKKASKTDPIKVMLSDGTTYTIENDKGVTAGEIHFGAKSASRADQRKGTALANEVITLAIPKGKTYAIVLADGTSVKINSASVLKFPLVFSGKTREVELDGEAYLEVAKNAKPFIVKTPEMDVKVLGTKFNVNTYPGNDAQTSLIEGSVAISNNDHTKEFLIKPGQAAVKRANNLIAIENFSTDKVLSWLGGTYYFSNMPLREIVNITNRVTGEDLYITDSKIANYRFSGALEIDKPIKVLLENIKASSSQIQYTIKDGRIELY
ncbi:FecR family protein [Pedobacter sp. UBA4863]|uniref:FecR family protein n=1 Tax=Pedobacter sp. UBA4863 TaxID=1947060 RepID=UPI0025F02612|nr:FecR domain-containing protein [Pedobacter sp. UBA4863]